MPLPIGKYLIYVAAISLQLVAHSVLATTYQMIVEPEIAVDATTGIREYKPIRNPAIHTRHIAMGPIESVLSQSGREVGKTGIPLQIGVSREVGDLHSSTKMQEVLEWEALPNGGNVTALAIDTGNAKAVRMGLRVYRLPVAARVRIFTDDQRDVSDISGQAILAQLKANQSAGERGESANTWWSPVVTGARIHMELELPPGIGTREVQLAIPYVSHIVVTPDAINDVGSALACQNDFSCNSEWATVGRATAHMLFTESGRSYLCTGTLLNDTDGTTAIPYLLSANHCFSTQSAASTLHTYWFFQSSACNSERLDINYRVLTGGATLLHATADTDTLFVRLKEAPPVGAVFAGWQTDLPAIGADVVGIHHPSGDLKKISFGGVNSYATCQDGDDDYFFCNQSNANLANHIIVSWNSGTTENGSSGSGLFNSNRYLVGTLHGGTTSGTCTGDLAMYGRFDLPFRNKLHEYLAPSMQLSYELQVSLLGTGSGTVSGLGISCGTNCTETYSAGTIVTLRQTPSVNSRFIGWEGACSGTADECVVTMDTVKQVYARYDLVGQMTLRDAIYIYNQPIHANAYKALIGINCDVFQLVLDVTSGFSDFAYEESGLTYYPDRILSTAAMFSYALYSDSATKRFLLWDNNPAPDGQIGTASFFGYCYSTNPSALTLYYDDSDGSCHRSDNSTVDCQSFPSFREQAGIPKRIISITGEYGQ